MKEGQQGAFTTGHERIQFTGERRTTAPPNEEVLPLVTIISVSRFWVKEMLLYLASTSFLQRIVCAPVWIFVV